MDKFQKIIEFVLAHEGYKSNDSADLGGLTIFGISHKYHPVEVENMNKMSKEDAKECAKGIYYREYWSPCNCINYTDKVALAILDSAVNCGVETVNAWIQDISRQFNGNPVIITAHDIIFKRQQLYINICNNNPSQKVFLMGWLQRTLDLWNYHP